MRGLNWERDGVSVLAVEPANSARRAMNVDPRYYKTSLSNVPNFVAELDGFPTRRSGDDGYETAQSYLFYMRHKSKVATSEGYFAVGAKAQQLRSGRQLLDTHKYDDHNYLSALIASALLEQYPDGRDNIVLGITHPFNYNKKYCEHIRNSVIGRYDIGVRGDGNEIVRRVYQVRHVINFIETEGSIAYLETKIIPLLNGHVLDNVKLFDIGHKTVHEFDFQIRHGNTLTRLVPIYETARVYDAGGGVYLDMLAEYLAVNYKSELEITADRVPMDDKLFRAMDTGFYRPFGKHQIDVTDFIEDLKWTAGRDLRDIRASRANNNRADAILWVGGGSQYFAYSANAMCFPLGFVWNDNSKLIATGDELRYANLRGIRNQMGYMAQRGDFTPHD